MPVGLVIFAPPHQNRPRFVTYPHYVEQILQHAGVCHHVLDQTRWTSQLADLAILITVGQTDLEETQRSAVQTFVQRGGTWISIAATCGLDALLGIEKVESRSAIRWAASDEISLGEFYLAPADTHHPAVRHITLPLHGFGGLAARARKDADLALSIPVLDKHHRLTDRVALSIHETGRGRAVFLAADLPGTVTRIQQGVAVTRDGVSSPEGDGQITDGVLKTDDGMVLDWLLDRTDVPGANGMAGFLCPMADHWRQVLLGLIFDSAKSQGVSLPVLWYWPDRQPAVAHLSFDSDGNDPDLARILLEQCDKASVTATWCVIKTGYDRPLIEEIDAKGHELAMHYDAMSPDRPWSHEQFLQQHAYLTELFGQAPLSNKNHYLRWQGDTQFYHWLEEVGIELDESKGTSKTGEFGFNFGTCHPFRPLDEDGSLMHVMELPTLTQDLEVFAPAAAASALLDAVLAAHGVFHLLFHPAHMDKPPVREAFERAVTEAKAKGLRYWNASQINIWQRARQTARWHTDATGHPALHVEKPLTAATVLWLDVGDGPPAPTDADGAPPQPMRCWGFDFHSMVTDLEP